MVKIYTRTGDSGTTGLYGGVRVAKDAARVEAYGTLDELNACLGMAAAALDPAHDAVIALLARLQSELFDLGWELSTPAEQVREAIAARVPTTTAAQVEALEREIDRCEDQLEPLRTFILPGGSQAAAALHLARTVARRAERRVVSLAAQEPLNPEIVRYLNRLSDLLFVLARTANRLQGVDDVPWQPRRAP
jgi:cob(I)alamin adenosyltransferase